MRARRVFHALALAAAGIAAPAFGSGNEHVVDDAAVETPGTCHLESWVSIGRGGTGLTNLSPACTRKTWPNLEIGGFVTHGWTRTSSETVIGIAPKLTLRSEERGIGIGVATMAGYSIDRHRLENASVIVPVTIPAGDRVRFNLNAGWQWFRLGNSHAAFVGAQAEIALRRGLGLMVEGFGRDTQKRGGQAGLRWTSRKGEGNVDIDLVAGRYVDGVTPTTFTIGLTLRR